MNSRMPHLVLMSVGAGLLALLLGWIVSHNRWGGPMALVIAVVLPLILLVHRRLDVGIFLLFCAVSARFALAQYLPDIMRHLLVEGMLALLLLVYIVRRILARDRQHRGHNPLDLPLACFLACLVISAAITLTPLFTVAAELRALLLFIPVYYLILHTPWREGQPRNLLAAMLVVGLLIGTFALTQIHSEMGSWGGERYLYATANIARVYGVMMNPNGLGVFLMTFLLLGFAWYPAAGRWRRRSGRRSRPGCRTRGPRRRDRRPRRRWWPPRRPRR